MSAKLQCHGCRHFAWGALDSERCAAFPEGIPDAIWLGEVDHASPYPGDGGVRREAPARPGETVELRHAMWGKRAVDRIEHAKDPLGAIVTAVDRVDHGASPEAPIDAPTLRAAWLATHDAPAMLLVLLRAGRTADLARAVGLTQQQLGLEGCDYLDDKGWLGVGLTLASFETEAALENARAAWSALSQPFRDGYVTARTQLILLRSMRRVVPEPPRASEWARPAEEIDATGLPRIGTLDDAVVALRIAPPKQQLHITEVPLLEPWTRVTNAQGLEDELARELVPGHRLHGRTTLKALARRTDCDDVLFGDDTLAAVVQLTWGKQADPATPSAELYPSLELWVAMRMNPDHDAFVGPVPRVFALEFRSTLLIDAIFAKVPDAARWKWTMADSHWYGDYVSGRDDLTRIRIYAEDDPGRFAIQADIFDRTATGDGWFETMRAHVLESLLPAIGATDVVPMTPEYD